MNNLYAGSGLRPKYIIADIDTYQKGPEDDLYPNFPVNYLKLDKVPGPDEDWSPGARRAPQRRLLRDDRRDPDPCLQESRAPATSARSSPTSSGRSRCRSPRWSGATARRSTARSSRATDLGAFGTQAVPHPVRRGGEGVGALRGLGLGGQRGVRPAGVGQNRQRLFSGSRSCPVPASGARSNPRGFFLLSGSGACVRAFSAYSSALL